MMQLSMMLKVTCEDIGLCYCICLKARCYTGDVSRAMSYFVTDLKQIGIFMKCGIYVACIMIFHIFIG